MELVTVPSKDGVVVLVIVIRITLQLIETPSKVAVDLKCHHSSVPAHGILFTILSLMAEPKAR